MHQNLALLINIAAALLAAFVGGYAARRLRLPPLIGYLLAGLAIGPFTPGFVGDVVDIAQLAELGVIFMLFGVGLHFSLKDLWEVRAIAVPGALIQVALGIGLSLLITPLWGWTVEAAIVLGLAISIASTVVLLRNLADAGLLHTAAGRVAVGWLVFEDLLTVAILVLMPALFGDGGNPVQSALVALVKTAAFVAIMLFVGKRFLPWLLTRIAFTHSRELFILAVVALALGTALAAAELFGVSLALGAFLAGVVIGESSVSHQVGAEVLPFRDVFTVIFFVSIGMLVNPVTLVTNAGQVLILVLMIMVGKSLYTILMGSFLPASGNTILVVAAALSQIGEFSFLVGQAAVGLGVMTSEQYSLILAASLITIVLNPAAFKLITPAERALRRYLPWFWRVLQRHVHEPPLPPEPLRDHVVVVGYGRVGEHIVTVLRRLHVPLLVIERDARLAVNFHAEGLPTMFGDASNSEILTHAHLDRACALVVTISDETATELVVTAAHDLALNLPIIARAATHEGVHRLARKGAHAIIHPELEGGLEVIRHTLLALNYPMGQVQQYIDAVRADNYDSTVNRPEEMLLLDQLVATVRGIDVTWRKIAVDSEVVGRTLAEANLRAQTGASIVALVRNHEVIANPKSNERFAADDLVALIGDAEQVGAAERVLNPHMPLSGLSAAGAPAAA